MPETKRFYYFTPANYALESIKNQRLKAAELDKANDPYEMLPIMWDEDKEEKLLIEIRKLMSRDFKMICMSEKYGDPSLWGHYADKCRGVALGFDIEVHEDERKRHIREIKYVEKRMDMSDFDLSYTDGRLEVTGNRVASLLHFKSYHWEHEKEWRMWNAADDLELDPMTGLYFFPFSGGLELREILIGFCCEERDIKQRIERLIAKYSDPKPAVFFTRPSISTFDFEIEKVT